MKRYRTLFGFISKKVFNEIRKGGWAPSRYEEYFADDYARLLGSNWVPAAESFICSFAGLSFRSKLWVWKEPLWDQDLINFKDKIADVIGRKAIPVATSSYMCEGCVIWLDEIGRFYATNSEGMIYLGGNIPEFLEIILGDSKPPDPSSEIKNKLINGYEWFDQ